MAKIYLSSPRTDLAEIRKEVADTLRRQRHTVISMEDYGASGRPPLARCLDDVGQCDIYVGILAFRYGSAPVCTENSIRVDDVIESPKLAE